MQANKGGRFKKKIFFCLLAAILFCSVTPAICQSGNNLKPTIKDVLLTQCQDELCINFRLSKGLTEKMERILQSGIPVKYIFDISLKKKRLLWDDELKHIELVRTIVLDNIRDEYILTFYYPSTRIITVSNIDDAKKFLLNIRQLRVIALDKLSKGQRYFISIKAMARKGEASMPFGRLIKMFSSFGFSTDTYEIEFQY